MRRPRSCGATRTYAARARLGVPAIPINGVATDFRNWPVPAAQVACRRGGFGGIFPPHLRRGVAAESDLGCVKTPKTEKRLEWFFSSRAKLNSLTNIRAPECDLAERSFYRLRAPERFYTAKTHFGHSIVIRVTAHSRIQTRQGLAVPRSRLFKRLDAIISRPLSQLHLHCRGVVRVG